MNIKKILKRLLSLFLEHRNTIDFTVRVTNLAQYLFKKEYIEAVKSGIDLVEAVGRDYYHAEDFLVSNNGWEKLFTDNEMHIVDLFDLERYERRSFKLRGTSAVYVYTLSNKKEVAVIEGSYYYEKCKILYYNTLLSDKDELISILTQDMYNKLNSQCMILCDDNLDKRKSTITIKPYILEKYSSNISLQLEQYLTKSIEMNVPRSIMLYSQPGTGKSCIAANALHSLNLKTLKIDNFHKVSTDFVQLLINIFKIEAILIDDFDHMNVNSSSEILDFLEKIRKQVKVIIATVNSTKAFHKALLRPGRFDKVIHVNSLDEGVVKRVLGEDLVKYYDRVKDWPIAFINELSINSKLEPHITINEMIDGLQKRVGDNSEDTVDLHKKPEDKKKSKKKAKKDDE